MKIFTQPVTFLFLCLFSTVTAKFAWTRSITDYEKNICIMESNVSHDELQGLRDMKSPKTHEQNCLVSCLFKKADVMTRQSRFVPINVAKFIAQKFNIPKSLILRVKDSINFCLYNASVIRDDCFSAGYMYTCIMDHRKDFERVSMINRGNNTVLNDGVGRTAGKKDRYLF